MPEFHAWVAGHKKIEVIGLRQIQQFTILPLVPVAVIGREYLVALSGALRSDAPQNSQAGAWIPARQKCINGDGFGNRLGIRAGIRGLHDHRRWNDLRIFVDGQSPPMRNVIESRPAKTGRRMKKM
jgi:hypothetical protein